MLLSAKLTALRKKQGMSVQTLADKVNIARQTLSLYESGDNSPTVDVLENICMALGIHIAELFDETISDPKKKLDDADINVLSTKYLEDISEYFKKCPTLEDKECLRELVKTFVGFRIMKS